MITVVIEFMALGLLILGLLGLWLGTELTIHGAVDIAKRLKMSEFIVGVAVVSVGSDLPELTIAVTGALQNLQLDNVASDVIVGSAIGSALGQIGLVMGITGLLGYLTLPREVIYRHGSILVGSCLVLGLCGMDGVVSRTEAATLLVLYLIYLIFLLTERRRTAADEEASFKRRALYSWLLLLFGLVVVMASAEVTVNSASSIAQHFAIDAALVSVIIVGVGTSLPELSISIGAVIRKKTGLSVGNLIGSNVFDTLVPIGVAGVIAPMKFDSVLLRGDLPFLAGLSLLVLILFVRKRGLQRQEALIILTAYCTYVIVRISHL